MKKTFQIVGISVLFFVGSNCFSNTDLKLGSEVFDAKSQMPFPLNCASIEKDYVPSVIAENIDSREGLANTLLAAKVVPIGTVCPEGTQLACLYPPKVCFCLAPWGA